MRHRVLRVLTYVSVLAATVGGVYMATRNKPPAMASDHNHGVAMQANTAAKSVMLSESDARRIGVTFETVTLGSLSREIRTVGQVTFDETLIRAIAPRIDGWVEQLMVNETGQAVVVGQPLLTIHSPALVTAQEELLLARKLQGDLSSADTASRGRAADLSESARRRLAYWDISENEIDEIEHSGEVRRVLTLRSPARGYVLQKNVLAGQRIMAGEALYRVADLRTVWVEGEVFEQDLSSVRLGQRVVADFESLPGEHRVGSISYVYPTLDPETRTVRIRIVLSNEDLHLKPGMYATIRIVGAQRNNVLTIPRSSVLSTGERSIVFVREANGQLRQREVTLGASSADRVEVIRGLAAGETVVSSGTFLLDAEANLGSASRGMGNMPGMEMTMPSRSPETHAAESHTGHRE